MLQGMRIKFFLPILVVVIMTSFLVGLIIFSVYAEGDSGRIIQISANDWREPGSAQLITFVTYLIVLLTLLALPILVVKWVQKR
jgi:hypothetical protein